MSVLADQIVNMIATTALGTIVWWILNGLRTRTEKIRNKTENNALCL